MTASRLRKQISRALMVSWREQPTRYDIEALQANVARVGLVIRVRWVLILVLVVYSSIAGLLYATRIPAAELAQRMLVPAIALAIVVVYNTFYSFNYRRLGNIAVWNNLQLFLDALVVTVLVYFSGGVNSWFWSMYSLFILEAAFILPSSRQVWGLALSCVLLLGGVELLEFLDVIPHVDIPFASSDLHHDAVFVAVRFLWQVAVLAGTAWVATLLVGEMRAEITARHGATLTDRATGLYSRNYFMRAFSAELRRDERDGRPLHVLLIDIDRFGEFNTRFGIEAGDRLLKVAAQRITEVVGDAGDVLVTTNLVARYGGEEFVVMLAEDSRVAGHPRAADARRLGESLRAAIEALRVEGAGVTVSVGVASAPDDGSTVDALLDAADAALACAIEGGGNRVISAEECLGLAEPARSRDSSTGEIDR